MSENVVSFGRGREPPPDRRAIDIAMLSSLEMWFLARLNGYRGPHSFNDGDVAELMERLRNGYLPVPLPGRPQERTEGDG